MLSTLIGHLSALASTTTFGEEVAPATAYVALDFTNGDSALAYPATDSASSLRLVPQGLVDSYLSISAGGSAAAELNAASTFSFLWGSPDTYNRITLDKSMGTQMLTGLDFQTMFGIPATGRNANTRLVTIAALTGKTLDSVTFASSGNAFEVAEPSLVSDPATRALFLAGVGAVAWTAKRRSA